MKAEIKTTSIKLAITFGLLFSLATFTVEEVVAQDAEALEISDVEIDQEIDQELQSLGKNPNTKSHSTMVKKITKTSKVQTVPVVTSSVPAAETKKIQTITSSKTIQPTEKISGAKTPTKKVVTTKTMNSLPVSIQKQPVTFVQATPLSASRADEIRRKRQDEEMRTESKIVEKLEQSRIEDERRRAELLFADRLDAKPVPVVVEQKTTSFDESEKTVAQEVEAAAPLSLESTTTESTIDMSEMQKEPAFFDSKYVALTAGVPAYPDYENIKGNYNIGLKFGMGHDRFLFEVGLAMAQFVLEDSFYGNGPNSTAGQYNFVYGYSTNGQVIGNTADFELKQYSGSLGSRYQILDGFVRPNVGGEFVYSYRQYSSLERTLEVNSFGAGTVLPEGTNYGNSHSLDFGVLAGVDLAVNQSFTIGADFKYLINVAHRINGDNSTSGTPIEKLQHFVGGLSARFQF